MSLVAHYHQHISLGPLNHEQVIYDHLLDCVRNESTDQSLNRFHTLFILGQRYPSPVIRESLEQVLRDASNPEDLILFLNRCCYIFVNHWQMNPQAKAAIGELVSLIDQVTTPGMTRRYDQGTKRLRSIVYQYGKSHYCVQLRRIAEFVRDKGRPSQQEPLISLIDRYPYLYSHCLKSTQEDPAHDRLIRQAQAQAQQKYEQDLSRFMALSVLGEGRSPLTQGEPIKNPTLLSPKDLHQSLTHFVGPSTSQGTYRDMSNRFVRTVDHRVKFQAFKDNLYDYLTADVDPTYGNSRFYKNLREQLITISPEHHLQPVTDILKTRTYNRLLNYLVIESRQAPKHFVFMDLISNLGSTLTVGLLLKLVLLDKSVKFSLERRLGMLFQHYESYQQGAVQWLVRCLEKVNLALASHFGKLNVSYLMMVNP